jgi:hypothetical protein
MTYQISSTIETIRQLALLRGGSHDEGYRFALAWLVGARMSQLNMLGEGNKLATLTEQDVWTRAHPVIGKLCVDIIWNKQLSTQNADLELTHAAGIVSRLIERTPDFYLSVPDALFFLPALRNSDWPALAPEACDLLFGILNAPQGSTVWFPFDPLGQLTARALKLGLNFETAGPRAWASDTQQICRAILGVFEESPAEGNEVVRGPDGKREFEVDYLIAVPPMGARLPQQLDWYEWEGEDPVLSQSQGLVQRLGIPMHLRLDRSDTWTPAALWPRVKRSAVFVTAQSLLFARGQEQRLREAWVRGSYPLSAVLSLPGRMFAHTSLAPAILHFSNNTERHVLKMADFSEFILRTGLGGRMGKTLNLQRCFEALDLFDPFEFNHRKEDGHISTLNRHSTIDDSKSIRLVTFSELMGGECNLQPSRYLQPPLQLSGDRNKLRDLVQVIRAPVSSNDPFCVEAIEVGMPELDGWYPIEINTETTENNQVRKVQIRERRIADSALTKGDIVMSIKGTVGRTALINKSIFQAELPDSPLQSWRLVTSGNCIALRPISSKITSEYLLLYFRSKEFMQQLEALLVGAVIPHVTPDALCDAILIPIPSINELSNLQMKYQRLCELEEQSMIARHKISVIVNSLWNPEI